MGTITARDGTRARRPRRMRPPPTSPPQQRDRATTYKGRLNRDLLAFIRGERSRR